MTTSMWLVEARQTHFDKFLLDKMDLLRFQVHKPVFRQHSILQTSMWQVVIDKFRFDKFQYDNFG